MRVLPSMALALGLALATACAPYQEPAPTASLPPDAVQGAGDPLNSALSFASTAFASPRRLAGQPDVAARAVASMEYLAVDLPQNPRLRGAAANVVPRFPAARQEWRGALGITQSAPPQAVINALFAAARALDAGQESAAVSALSSPIFTRGGAGTLAVLSDMPRLPLTNSVAVEASEQLVNQFGLSGRR